MALDLRNYIASIENYPEEGIIFRDISPLMADGEAYRQATDRIVQFAKDKGVELGVGFAPARKKGKLPRETVKADYSLEYGTASLNMHKDAVKPGQKVLVTDDLLATGGSIGATIDLVEQLGGVVVGCAFIIELEDLHGRDKIKGYDTLALMKY